ncbi:MAG TPA: HAMP domain-containing sensor histidine kinase [Sphingomonas sp.]|nr:HAMP domain-containing sensor histidine kinase [Sphingomonas sp.]
MTGAHAMPRSSARRALGQAVTGIALTLAGAAMVLAWRGGLWATLAGAVLATAWLVGLGCWTALRAPLADDPPPAPDRFPDGVLLHALLDQVPVPLVRRDAGGARALNRAARAVFATEDRIVPVPPALASATARHLRHEGRRFRIDRVDASHGPALAALIDVDAEERAAEARADDEMIDILGHELLNGLSPVVSLADSAVVAAERADPKLPAILATLARRVEGLERFTQAYRTLARLPDPVPAPVAFGELADDLSRLFALRFDGRVSLTIAITDTAVAAVDRDQLVQAIWALLQNAGEAAIDGDAAAQVALGIVADANGLTIDVSDSGGGIPEPDRARIFRPFHTTKPDGSGIGLSLARRIARAHRGDLTLLPEIRTTLRLRLPL